MLWEEISDRADRLGANTKNVFQEEMQKTVLAFLSRKGCFESIVFHGGTALRLFHGNPRFSEDIDFVLREGMEEYDLSTCIMKVDGFCRDMLPFLTSVHIKTQKHRGGIQRYALTASSDGQEGRLQLHIELASVPSYRHRPMILDYPPMQPAVMVEDPVEILADKICALVLRPYTKGRDLWDIYFLTKERSVEPQWDLVLRKVQDCGCETSGLDKIEGTRARLMEDGPPALRREMDRFLPEKVWAPYRHSLDMILESVSEILTTFEGKVEDDVC